MLAALQLALVVCFLCRELLLEVGDFLHQLVDDLRLAVRVRVQEVDVRLRGHVAAAVGGELLDDLAGMMRIVNAGVSAVKNFVKENGQLVRVVGMVLIGVGGLGVALMTIGGTLVGAGMAFSVLASAIGGAYGRSLWLCVPG